MTLATMKHQIALPGGVVGNQVKARVRLITTDDSTDGFGTATGANLAIGGARTVAYDEDGLITLTSMNPTSGSSDDVIDTPTGCVYELVTTYPDGRSITEHFTVPDSAGPHWVHDYYSDPPASVTAQLGHSSLTGRTAASSHPSTAVDHGAHTVSAALEAAAPARPSNIHFAGHSFLDARGIGASNQGRGTAPRLAALLGVDPGRVNNLAASGAALRAAELSGAARYLQDLDPGVLGSRPLVAHVGLAVIWFDQNDAAVWGTAAANLAAYEAGLTALICRYLAAGVYDYNDASVASSGSWSTTSYSAVDPPYGSGAGMSYSSSVGASKTITLPALVQAEITAAGGAWVDLTFVTAYADSGCTVAITVNGAAYGSKTMRRAYLSDEHGLDVARVWCPAGTTTVAFSITSATAGAVRFDGWSIEATVTPPVAVLEMVLPSDPAWVWNNIDQTVVDAFNTSKATVVALFNTPGVVGATDVDTVFVVDGLDDALGADTVYFADGMHPGDVGSGLVAHLVAGKLQELIAAGTLTRQNFAAWWYGELDPLTSAEYTLARGDGDPLELVDGFDRADENTLSTAGWTAVTGGWGVFQGQLALVGDKFPYPDLWDDFERADGAVGNGWTQTAGTWVIDTGEVKLSASAPGRLTSPNALTSGDGWIEYVQGSTPESEAGVFFRYVDANNYWRAVRNQPFGTWFLTKVEAGVATTVLNPIYSGGTADGTRLGINLSGTTMQFFVNGVLVNTHTSSVHENGTGCGLYALTAGGIYRWADWKQGTTPIDTSDDALFNLVTRDFGATVGAISFKVGATRANFNGFVFRYVDKDNWLALYEATSYGAWVLIKCIAGTITTVTSPITGSTAVGTVVTVAMVTATTFRIYFDGVECGEGLQTIADAPAGTKYGFRVNTGTTVPVAVFDRVLEGESVTTVEDGQWYRNDQTGEEFGPFVDGVPVDSVVWLPEDLTTSGFNAAALAAVPAASDTVAGKVELATNAETVTGTDTARATTPAGVAAALAALVDAAPAALDTLNELAAALGDDASFSTTVTNALAGKLAAASNLSDLASPATSRTNLGLGTAAVQAVGDFVQADDGGKEEYDSHGGAAVGATETIDLANGNVHRCILDENVTFTFTGSTASVACSFTLILVQDGTGGNTVTWPASVSWIRAGGAAPTVATAASKITVVSFVTVDNGTTWLGFSGGSNA